MYLGNSTYLLSSFVLNREKAYLSVVHNFHGIKVFLPVTLKIIFYSNKNEVLLCNSLAMFFFLVVDLYINLMTL